MLAIKRLIALIIDSILLGIVSGILGAILGQEIGGFIGIVVGILYQVIFLTQNNGQTPGKMLLGLRVVMNDGSKVTALAAALRYIGYFVNTILLFTGWIFGAITGRGFHDYIAGTKVVD
ncbi:MAG: RDD family protein [Anaerolineales bacterium]